MTHTNLPRVMTWNAHSVRSKRYELFDMLVNDDISICCITETFLNSSDSFNHPNFLTYRLDRDAPDRGGGIAICVKRNINHKLLPCVQTRVIESLSIEFYSSNEKFVISTIYFPGSNNPNVLADFKNDIRTLSSLHDNHLITGDFNCRHSFWGCQRSNAAGRILYDEMCNNQFLIFHPNEPTHYPDNGRTPSVLDFFLVKGSFHPSRRDQCSQHITF